MPEFLTLIPPEKALTILLSNIPTPPIASESIDAATALGRITAVPIYAPHPLPTFTRSAVDGYAVQAADTYGASDSLPVYLKLIGEVLMGEQPVFSIAPLTCGLIHTGGMLPEGANAVAMLEYTQQVSPNEIEIRHSIAIGENVINIGEDILEGQLVIPKGHLIRPVDIGGLLALGITKIEVTKKPVVGIISTGDELIPPQQVLKQGQVRNINSYTLSSLVTATGGQPLSYGIISDNYDDLYQTALRAMKECSLIIITAGSSASVRDLTAGVISALGKPGVLVHGVNIRPGKPTILGICDDKPVIGLPGNPVSAFVIARLFVVPLIHRLLGLEAELFQPTLIARLTANVPSQAGREDWLPVKLHRGPNGLSAEPIFIKSNLIFTLVRADGLIRIPENATGISMNEAVEVVLL